MKNKTKFTLFFLIAASSHSINFRARGNNNWAIQNITKRIWSNPKQKLEGPSKVDENWNCWRKKCEKLFLQKNLNSHENFFFLLSQTRYTIAEYKQQLKDQIKPKGGILNKRVNLTISNNLWVKKFFWMKIICDTRIGQGAHRFIYCLIHKVVEEICLKWDWM